jgi:hypothetical protein
MTPKFGSCFESILIAAPSFRTAVFSGTMPPFKSIGLVSVNIAIIAIVWVVETIVLVIRIGV